MPDTADDFALMSFSTRALPEHERIPVVRDFYGPLIVRFAFEPVSDEPFVFESVARRMPDLTIVKLTSSPVRLRRSGALLADGDDRVSLAVALSDGGRVSQLDRELVRTAGMGYLCSHADRVEGTTAAGLSRFINISVPRKRLAADVPQLEDRFLAPIQPQSEALRLLTGYLELLERDYAIATPDLRRLVTTHLHDLVAVALGASRDAAAIANNRGLRAARLHAIKTDIRASLAQKGLSLTTIAARHHVSPRYVQVLFEGDGTSFSHFLLGERLERVHCMLRDPLLAARKISALADAGGFSDLSHFNRAFRSRYGLTPSDVRASARRAN